MSYYAANPYEAPEMPRCGNCDEQLGEEHDVLGTHYICTNPRCDQCDPRHKWNEGDDGTCINCGDVIEFIRGAWIHYEDNEVTLGNCEQADPGPRRNL